MYALGKCLSSVPPRFDSAAGRTVDNGTYVVEVLRLQCALFLSPEQCRSFPFAPFPGLSSARKPRALAAVVSNSSLAAAVAATATVENLADRLRLGSLTEDGLSYEEKFIVRCYEVGISKTATVETISNLLQEVGGNHAQSVGFTTDGFATTPTMRKLNLIWLTSRMHIEIYKYPACSDVIEIETWCQAEGRIGFRRDKGLLQTYPINQISRSRNLISIVLRSLIELTIVYNNMCFATNLLGMVD